ncbi:TfuA-like protein [Myxococcaceae bacterium GXIMD 01537]
MSIIVFTGPSLSADEGRAELDATFLPPAAQGDLYRATLGNPRAIALIDGYFERVPAVWHKEVLWAMSQGIHVFGASSMGALRAVELAPFGMEGVGGVFEAFQRGELEDDDEVAVAHGPAETGYRALSEAMVNIRATLAAAQAQGVLRPETREVLVRLAKETYYFHRAWPPLLERAMGEGLPREELDALRAWLPTGRVNAKRDDALALLRHLRTWSAQEPAPKRVRYTFENTDTWEEARRQSHLMPSAAESPEGRPTEDVLEEVRLSGALPWLRREVLARALALEETRRMGRTADSGELADVASALSEARGLTSRAEFARWCAEQDIADVDRFLREEADVRWVETLYAPDVERGLPDHLRVAGTYGALRERARHKRRTLAERGLEQPQLADADVTEPELWRWYFVERLGVPVPGDLSAYAREHGYTDESALRRAALRERCFVRLTESSPSPLRRPA